MVFSSSSTCFKRPRLEGGDEVGGAVAFSIQEDGTPFPLFPLSKAANNSIAVAHALGKVGTNVWEAVQSQLKDSAERLKSSQQKITHLEGALITQQIENAQSELTSLALASDLQHCTQSVEALAKHLQGCSADVAAAITSRVDDAVQHTFYVVQSQVDCERRQNSCLLQKVSEVVSSTSTSLQHSNQELLNARLSLAKKDVVLRKMKAKYASEEEKNRGLLEEVQLLLKMNRHLAEKAKTMEATTQELSRTKHYIRQLEQCLCLPQIVQAVAVNSSRVSSTSLTGDRPSIEEQAVMDCRAIKFLLREDLTISELVHAWQTKEEQKRNLEAREEALKETFLDLQRQVLVVHHHYLEEKQRREIQDRRLSEIARERLLLSSKADGELLDTLQELQMMYSEALDDKTELKVALSLANNELTRLQQVHAELKERAEQLKKDAEGDQVARTLAELRTFYTQKVEQMQKRLEEVEVEKNAYLAHSEATSTVLERCQETLRHSKENFEQLMGDLPDVGYDKKNDTHHGFSSRSSEAHTDIESPRSIASKALQSIATLHQTLEKVKSAASEGSSLRKEQKESSRVSSGAPLMGQGTPSETIVLRINAATTALKEASKELYQTTTTLLDKNKSSDRQKMGAMLGSLQNARTEKQEIKGRNHFNERKDTEEENAHHSVDAYNATSTYKRETAMKTLEMMEKIVKEVLGFVAKHMERTNAEKSSLIHRSLEDAQLIQTLTMTLERLGKEQMELREQLQQSKALIAQNDWSILEHDHMKGMAVEESMEADEAAEQLVLLRAELETSQQSLAVAHEEMNLIRTRCESLEDASTREALRKKFLTDEIEDLKVALAASKEKEAAAVQRYVEVIHHFTQLLPRCFKNGNTRREEAGSNENGEADSSSHMPSILEGVGYTQEEEHPPTNSNDREDLAATIIALQTSLKEDLHRMVELVQQASDRAKETEEEATRRDNDLLRKGYSHVLIALRTTCEQLGLLKEAKDEVRRTSMREITKLYAVGEELKVMEMTPESKVLALTEAMSAKEDEQKRMTEEIGALHHQLQQYEETMGKMKEREQRLLAMCKKMSMDHQKNKAAATTSTTPHAESSTTFTTATPSSAMEATSIVQPKESSSPDASGFPEPRAEESTLISPPTADNTGITERVEKAGEEDPTEIHLSEGNPKESELQSAAASES